MSEQRERAARRFQTATNGQPPTPQQRAAVTILTELIVNVAVAIEQAVPEGRNKSLALTALEEVQMRANRGIFLDAPTEGAGS